MGTTELELECFMEELLLCLLLDDEFTDELDTSFLLLEEPPVFTELELLESEETFVSFVELLDTLTGSDPLTLLEDLSFSVDSFPDDFLSTEDDDSSKSEVSTDELEVPVSSELADDESSQAERAKNAASRQMVMSRPFGKHFGKFRVAMTRWKDFFIKTSPSIVYPVKYR